MTVLTAANSSRSRRSWTWTARSFENAPLYCPSRRVSSQSVPYPFEEGLPNAILEAIPHGTPVVATDTEGVEDGVTGYIGTGDIVALADQIERLRKGDRRQHMANSAREFGILVGGGNRRTRDRLRLASS